MSFIRHGRKREKLTATERHRELQPLTSALNPCKLRCNVSFLRRFFNVTSDAQLSWCHSTPRITPDDVSTYEMSPLPNQYLLCARQLWLLMDYSGQLLTDSKRRFSNATARGVIFHFYTYHKEKRYKRRNTFYKQLI